MRLGIGSSLVCSHTARSEFLPFQMEDRESRERMCWLLRREKEGRVFYKKGSGEGRSKSQRSEIRRVFSQRGEVRRI